MLDSRKSKYSGALFCFALASLIFFCSLAGCSDSRNSALTAIKDLNKSNIQKLTTCYCMYYAFKNSRGPKSEEELKSFINDSPNIDLQLERIGLSREDFEACFYGSDGEPMTVIYSVAAPSGPDQEKPIVFDNSDGSCRVGFSNGATVEVDEDEYDELLENAQQRR